jgi:hypothetical protein
VKQTIYSFPELAGVGAVGSDELGVVQSFGSKDGLVIGTRD